MKRVLVATAGPLQGSRYLIEGRTLLGRDAECDIQLIDKMVSRKHACVLEQDDGTVLLRDLASQNGSFVDDARVVEALLSPGDVITVGESRFEFRVVAGDAAETRELELKLVSGPAQEPTYTVPFSKQDHQDLLAQVKAERAARSTPTPPCCASPLSAVTREQGWKFCPACGRAVG